MKSSPLVIFVVGVAGSGKSTVSRRIASALEAAYLDKDRLAAPFTEALLSLRGEPAGTRDGSKVYAREIMPLEYVALLGLAADITSCGVDVVLDAPFGAYFGDPDFVTTRLKANEIQATAVVVRVFASKQATRSRLLARANPRDDWKLDHWDEFWAAQCQPTWTGIPIFDWENNDGLQLVTGLVQQLDEARS